MTERIRHSAASIRLGEQRTRAAADALACRPSIAMLALIAALETADAPLRVRNDGFPALRDDPNPIGFAARLQVLLDSDADVVGQALAAVVATTLDLRPGVDPSGVVALLGLLGRTYTDAARDTFIAAEYFQNAATAVIKFALAEMGEPLTGGTKTDLVERAAAMARETGWLPPELRPPTAVAVA